MTHYKKDTLIVLLFAISFFIIITDYIFPFTMNIMRAVFFCLSILCFYGFFVRIKRILKIKFRNEIKKIFPHKVIKSEKHVYYSELD